MRIRTTFLFPPIPARQFDWCAVDDDTYDGDGTHPIGYGETEKQAIDDLLSQFEDDIVRELEPFPSSSWHGG